MPIDEQIPPTGLTVHVTRANGRELSEPLLPDPLADPRLEFRVDKCTAGQFTVYAGEYIQIIDVAGRECSDFLASVQSQQWQTLAGCFPAVAFAPSSATEHHGRFQHEPPDQRALRF